jgi:hypothetical protein
MRKRKNNKKKQGKRKIETHTWVTGPRRRGFSQRLQTLYPIPNLS